MDREIDCTYKHDYYVHVQGEFVIRHSSMMYLKEEDRAHRPVLTSNINEAEVFPDDGGARGRITSLYGRSQVGWEILKLKPLVVVD